MASGGVGGEWRVGKKGRDVFAESGEVLEKSRLVFFERITLSTRIAKIFCETYCEVE